MDRYRGDLGFEFSVSENSSLELFVTKRHHWDTVGDDTRQNR